MSFHGSDSALGSSSLYLDGIPFRIGDKFKCPKKVTLPSSFVQPDVSAVLSDQYTFSTEEAVLKWLADVRQSEKDRRQRELERAQTEAEHTNNENDGSSDLENDDQTFVKETHDDSWHIESSAERKGAWSNPVIANISSDLLKPTPFASCSTPKNPKTTGGVEAKEFDIRLFEKVDDPFDNLELQVINEMEELKNVLQESQSMQNGTAAVSPDTVLKETENRNNSRDNGLIKTGTTRKNAVKLRRGKVDNMGHTVESYSGSSQEDCDYVNSREVNGAVRPQSKEDVVVNQLPPLNSSSLLNQRHTVMNPVLGSSALPPIGASLSSANQETEQRVRPKSNPELELMGKEQTITTRDSQYENVSISLANNASQGKTSKSYPSSYSRHSITADYVNMKEEGSLLAAVEADAVDGGVMRGAQSSPNLCHSNQPAVSQSPPPRPSTGQTLVQVLPKPTVAVPRLLGRNGKPAVESYENVEIESRVCSVEPTGPASSAPEVPQRDPHVRVVGRSVFYENIQIGTSQPDQESWNRYSPLPPPRTSAKITDGGTSHTKKAPDLPPKPTNQNRSETNCLRVLQPPINSTNQVIDKDDPYTSLSIEAQAFVNSLTTMGFPRPRAARAVLKLGQDHKLVVEHLCLINSMVEKGYSPILSEAALHLFANDYNKAVKYLDLYGQFQELGFQKEKIREALVRNDIDRDKALDYLTGTA